MENDFLIKYKDDPSWAEVIRLYSGLFDTQDEREDFILGIAETDIVLATECFNTSISKEIKTKELLMNKIDCFDKASIEYVSALFELDDTNLLNSGLKTLKTITKIIDKYEKNKIAKTCSLLINKKSNQLFNKKYLQLLIQIFENINIEDAENEIKNILDVFFENTKMFIKNFDVLGIDVVNRKYYFFEKYNYRKMEYASLIYTFVKHKKSRKKEKLLEKIHYLLR